MSSGSPSGAGTAGRSRRSGGASGTPGSRARQPFITCASWSVRRNVSPIRPMPCESEFTIWIAPSSCSGPSAAIVARVHQLLRRRDVLGQVRVPFVDDQLHVELLERRRRSVGERRRRRGAEHVRLANESERVRDVSAAGPLDVIGVDGAAGDRRDGSLELGRLVQRVGVQAHRDVVRVGGAERRVDDLRIRAPVLVDLEADRARLDRRIEPAGHVGPRARLEPEVHGQVLERRIGRAHPVGRFLEPGGDQGRHARRQGDRHEPRRQQVHVRVDDRGRRDQPVARDRPRVRSDREVDTVGDVRVARPARSRRSGRP